MPKFAYFDKTPPHRVIGWINTDKRKYNALPPAEDLLQLTDSQWEARMPDHNSWCIDEGKMVPYVPGPPPSPTPAQQAMARLNSGLTIKSETTPSISGTYAVDALTQGKLALLASYIARTGEFPASASYSLVDKAGLAHYWEDPKLFLRFIDAMTVYVARLNEIIANDAGEMPPAVIELGGA